MQIETLINLVHQYYLCFKYSLRTSSHVSTLYLINLCFFLQQLIYRNNLVNFGPFDKTLLYLNYLDFVKNYEYMLYIKTHFI